MQMLHVQAEGTSQPEHFESINGITPAMRNARKRHFNNAHVDHQEVQAAEDDLLQLASVRTLLLVYMSNGYVSFIKSSS